MPDERAERQLALDDLGRRAHAALLAGTPAELLADDGDLRALLHGAAASRVGARRVAFASVAAEPTLLALDGSEYVGVCVQDAADEPPGGPAGLRDRGWVVRRALVVARTPAGRRVALWLDGFFLLTDAGFAALDVERIETPRVEHADLEIAPCDMSTNLEIRTAHH